MGRTDANKKGDMFDGILAFSKYEPLCFADYPEQVLTTLRLFHEVWKIPEGGIPGKRSKSKFEEWVTQLDKLNQICPNSETMKEALEIALREYEKLEHKFIVYRPLAIEPLLIHAVAEIKRRQDRAKEIEKKEVEDKPASKEQVRDMVRELKSFLEEE